MVKDRRQASARVASMRRGAVAALLVAGLPAQWGAVALPAAPAPRAGALLAYDLATQRTLLFGGNWTNEFWSYDGAAWTQSSVPAPPPRSRAAWASEPWSGSLVLYGGDDASATSQFALDDTWTWSGQAWLQATPTVTPGGLARHAFAFDSQRQVAVLFGGRHDSWSPHQFANQTWEFAQGNWTLVAPATQSPPPLADAAFAFHPGLGTMVLFGGEDGAGFATDATWLYDGVDWQPANPIGVRPPPRVAAQMVPVFSRNTCLLIGGRDPQTLQILNDTWEFDGMAWHPVNGIYGGMYPPRAEFALAYDVARDRAIAFGGKIANNSLRDDTWEFGAQFQPFGLGCVGSAGEPALALAALPRFGTTCRIDVVNLPPSSPLAVMVLGLSRTQWALGSLPMLLTPFGMPGCRTYTSADLLIALTASGGAAAWQVAMPAPAATFGDTYYVQALSFDPGVNPAWLTTSAAATLVVGY